MRRSVDWPFLIVNLDKIMEQNNQTVGLIVSENDKINSKFEIRNTKQIPMTKIQNSKHYDLEERTLKFSKRTRALIEDLPKSINNMEDIKQLLRSSGSVGANYIEANEALSKKDFIYRIKISRKEAKESRYWLSLLISDQNSETENECSILIQEATELMNIFGSIIHKSE